jgi:EAL domain-containing protein (putative c-di-GMP-specific phosphodiesterase class I)
LIVPLGEWVLETACAQMQAWRKAGVFNGSVAVNLSPVQFRQPNIVDRVERILEKTGLPGTALELEITEGALIGDAAETQATLARLKALGVRLAIDDFGTGYSSLAYLKRFPIDTLKIDQSFVRDIPNDPADMEIAAAVISLARALHLKPLAEGIETEAQLEFLRSRGCELGQGYLFARPMPADDLTVFATLAVAA